MDRRIFYVIGAVAAAMLSSCAKVEMTDGGKALDPNQIAFSVRSGLQGPSGTRSGAGEEQPAMLLGGQGEDTLYLHPSVVVNDRGFGMSATRGVPIRDDRGILSFTVTAKVSGSNDPYMNEVEVTRQGDSDVWTTSDGKHFWPDEQTSLDFYAYSNLTETDNPDSPGVSGLTCEGGRLGFSYIVPNGPEGSDAVRQPDILFALASANRSQTQDGDGTVILNFEHALAGVQFRAKNIAGGTIKSITLKNLYAQGHCTYSLSDSPVVEGGVTKNGTFEWKTTGNKVKFSQNMNVGVSESSTLPDGTLQDVTTGDNAGMTFMMIPQKLENVEVEIDLVGAHDGRQYTVSGRLSTATGSWEAGNIYIYDISTDSINWTYVFDVTPSVTLELGQTSATYTVTSYRYRTQNPSEIQAVPWTSENIGATETDADPTSAGTFDIDVNDVLSEFTYSGEGAENINGVDYALKLSTPTMHTTYPGDATLKNAAGKGTEENPYDLSTHDENGGTINETTANCYVVDAPGVYKLPLVYGNALLNGEKNPDAYKGAAFVDYNGDKINQPYINNPHDCCLVWSDGYYMVKDVKLSDDKEYLVFTIDKDYLQQANAVVAVRDSEGKIMWSWHIWVTERKIYSENIHKLHDIFGSSRIYYMMQCNLGWVDGKTVYYNDRELNFRFTQSASGNVLSVGTQGSACGFEKLA